MVGRLGGNDAPRGLHVVPLAGDGDLSDLTIDHALAKAERRSHRSTKIDPRTGVRYA